MLAFLGDNTPIICIKQKQLSRADSTSLYLVQQKKNTVEEDDEPMWFVRRVGGFVIPTTVLDCIVFSGSVYTPEATIVLCFIVPVKSTNWVYHFYV